MSVSKLDQSSAKPDDELIDSIIGGRYRVNSLIGRGGMASVYRALDQSLPREVAVKLMLPGMADPDEIGRQHNEIDTLAALNHHALVTLFDAGAEKTPTGERVYLIMEFVDGPNLREAMTSPLPPGLVAHLGADIAEALHYMHGRGIVHRDVKPANILLAHSELPNRQFHAKLADFGIARLVDGSRLTSTGMIIGSASYLSPEQARGSETAGASDVYSLGLVLLEALTGKDAFPGNAIETIGVRLNHTPAVPDTLGDGWVDLLTNMTAIEADHRPPPMEIAVALRELANSSEHADAILIAPIGAVDKPAGNKDEKTSLQATKKYTAVVTQATEVINRNDAAPRVTTRIETPRAASPKPKTITPDRQARLQQLLVANRAKLKPFAIAALILVAVVVGVVIWSNLPAPAEPSGPTYPAVSGTLGTHLLELQESVAP
ncbi:MAG: serine/threonine-protein kinase [Rhodoglobus sp.]